VIFPDDAVKLRDTVLTSFPANAFLAFSFVFAVRALEFVSVFVFVFVFVFGLWMKPPLVAVLPLVLELVSRFVSESAVPVQP